MGPSRRATSSTQHENLLLVIDPSEQRSVTTGAPGSVHMGGGQSHRQVAATAKCHLQRRLVGWVSDRPPRTLLPCADHCNLATAVQAPLDLRCCWLHATALVFLYWGCRLVTKVTRRFCESASRRATAGQSPAATSRTASSRALESRRSSLGARNTPRGSPVAQGGSHASHVTGRAPATVRLTAPNGSVCPPERPGS